ncbi:MAG: amino acid ABC transporter permease [Aeromicrobium erythreum]
MSTSVLFDAPGPRARRRHRLLGVVTLVLALAVLALAVLRLQDRGQLTGAKWEVFVTPAYVQVLLEGLLDTLKAAVGAILLALVFGLVFGVGKLSANRLVRWVSWTVVEFFRAVPLLMLIVFVWTVWSETIGSLWSLIIGLALYNGAVLAEVFRAGIQAVPKGQSEAAMAIGLRPGQTMRIVLLPQGIKIMLPSIVSQFIVALKDTSLGYVILAPGLTYAGKLIWGEFDNRLATGLVLAAIYIVANGLLSLVVTWLQRRLGGKPLEIVPAQMQSQAEAR